MNNFEVLSNEDCLIINGGATEQDYRNAGKIAAKLVGGAAFGIVGSIGAGIIYDLIVPKYEYTLVPASPAHRISDMKRPVLPFR